MSDIGNEDQNGSQGSPSHGAIWMHQRGLGVKINWNGKEGSMKGEP